MEAIFDLQALREELNTETWEPADDGEHERRAVYLGSVFSLTPSGKYYMPFACGNVDPCPACNGRGSNVRKGRAYKRAVSRAARLYRKIVRARAAGHAARVEALLPSWRKASAIQRGTSCAHCGGVGSREAYLDKVWYEQAQAELESIGCSLESGEGDPCDLFAIEYREASEA